MWNALTRKIFGTANQRMLRSIYPIVSQINAQEASFSALSDEELRGKTHMFRERLQQKETLDSLLVEAFSTVREASKRVFGMRHFDVQLIGGIILHRGMIAEMRTGEGKTLVATLPSYLNALTGKGVHIVTVNDYLVQRDAEWMGKLYEFLGLSVGCIVHNITDYERKEAYQADITYATNNELGFDYLRDNMKFSLEERVQRPFNYALIDEVDSILIDEARTPLIISGPSEDSSELYIRMHALLKNMSEQDYEVDEKSRNVTLTEEGMEAVETLLRQEGYLEQQDSLYDVSSVSLVHYINQALRARILFTRDVDYIVKEDKVVIIDEFTGRMMEGRRFSEGLHQSLEAKEGVPVQNENQTLASITFQNYFRLYPKLAGMTGTAMTEATEFDDIYRLKTVDIPTNIPVKRKDEDDLIFLNKEDKYEAIITLIEELHQSGQPVLVGTVSIDKSEYISNLLKKRNIPHRVLNARHHEKEASIIAQAGRPGAVTLATNMAGRGTDIKLGGNIDLRIAQEIDESLPVAIYEEKVEILKKAVEADKEKVIALGGLYVILTERHESRRIDDQLRGRSGRQGDPGCTRSYLSLEDDLLRIFGLDRMKGLLGRLHTEKGEPLFHPLVTKSIENAQKKVEARNYDMRKNLLKYDNVMNDQRTLIYDQRLEWMKSQDLEETLQEMREEINHRILLRYVPENSFKEEWDKKELQKEIFRIYGIHLEIKEDLDDRKKLEEEIHEAVEGHFLQKEEKYGIDIMCKAKRQLLLMTLDHLWKDHLLSLDHLRQGINLRAYGQRDPLNEYKKEAFSLFKRMLAHMQEWVIERLSHIHFSTEDKENLAMPQVEKKKKMLHIPQEDAAVDFKDEKIGRNTICPCGSGLKYKHCHGIIV